MFMSIYYELLAPDFKRLLIHIYFSPDDLPVEEETPVSTETGGTPTAFRNNTGMTSHDQSLTLKN